MGGRVMRAGFALLDVLTIIGTRNPRKGRTIPNFFSQSFPADIPRGLGHPMRGSLRPRASMAPCRCRHGMGVLDKLPVVPGALQWGRGVADTECSTTKPEYGCLPSFNGAVSLPTRNDGLARVRGGVAMTLQWGRVVADTE